MPSATSDTSTATTGRYTVTLTPPAQASVALQQFIAMGQQAIQIAVDLLGKGVPELPPDVDDLMTTVTYQDLGSGTASSDYQNLLAQIESRSASLLSSDQQVLQASATASVNTASTLQYIQGIVSELQSEFTSITGKLTATENTAVMQQVGDAVDIINARVTSIYEANQTVAGNGNSGGDGSGSGNTGASYTGASNSGNTSSGSSSGSGLSSLMEILPMLAAPLISLAPELLKDLTKGLGKNGQQNPGQPGTPVQPGGPNIPAQPGATPPTTATAPANPGQPNTAPATANTTQQNQQHNQSSPAN